ncbi:uncharacterized protein LOC135843328 [Planococcus citri]|uniref:uncharacterized protein LOC135843328 n=1 Tax=Planococcus citri TaxID=170843 RepID=UPI0031FA1EFA
MNIYCVLLHIASASAIFWREPAGDYSKFDATSTFIDKTLLIEKFFRQPCKYQVITSPPGFGKTTNAYMLRRFVQIEVDESGQVKNKTDTSSYKIFTDKRLQISNHPDIIQEHLAEYPVIHFDYSHVTKENSYKTERGLMNKISKTFKRYKWLYTILQKRYAQRRDERETDLHRKVLAMGKLISESQHIYIHGMLYALCQLAELVHEYFQKKVFLIVDDYDSLWYDGLRHNDPFQMGYADWLHDLINLMFTPQFSKYIAYVFITGTHTISLKSEDFVYNRFLDAHPFVNYYGFTKEEVSRLLDRRHVPQTEMQQLQNLYNGYTTKSTKLQIFQPSLIIEYLIPTVQPSEPTTLSATEKKMTLKPWIDGDSMTLLKIALVNKEINEEIKKLAASGNTTFKMRPKINEQELQALSYNIRDIAAAKKVLKPQDQIETLTVDWFFTLLFENGYFTYTDEQDFYKVPNERKMNSLKAFSITTV